MQRALARRFIETRRATERLAAPLSAEDQQLQSMESASPTKWHRAHTTWFFEAFVLGPAGIAPHDPRFAFLFNSYYDTVGARVARHKRGLLSRPSASEIGEYRRVVDERTVSLLEALDAAQLELVAPILEIGLHHEQQHQELILTDILHAFAEVPNTPTYRDGEVVFSAVASPLSWSSFSGGLVDLGASADGFAFDNERPRHRAFLEPYALASRPITVGEVKAFIAGAGYHTPSLWLSDGYATARAQGFEAPLYATSNSDGYRVFSLRGSRTPSDSEPASHLSFWEAEAIARFMDARLPTEAEWENAAASTRVDEGNFADGPLVPKPVGSAGLAQLFGDVWEWTRSSYEPYPGFRAGPGALGEYNAKFMAQQVVLRGGSCLTPRGHIRASYRNFWYPDTRFQMSGARLARDI